MTTVEGGGGRIKTNFHLITTVSSVSNLDRVITDWCRMGVGSLKITGIELPLSQAGGVGMDLKITRIEWTVYKYILGSLQN